MAVMSRRFVGYRFVTDRGEIVPAGEVTSDEEALAIMPGIEADLDRLKAKWCTPCKVYEVVETMEGEGVER